MLKREKEALAAQLQGVQAEQGERIDELEMKFQLMANECKRLRKENEDVAERERECRRELAVAEKARDHFREEYLEGK